jgi:hypothetical protein
MGQILCSFFNLAGKAHHDSMMHQCIGYLVGGAAATGMALLILREPRMQRRTVDEVAPFLYDPNRLTLFNSFDSEEDSIWRRQSDRRLQWVRMEAFRKCLSVKVDKCPNHLRMGADRAFR